MAIRKPIIKKFDKAADKAATAGIQPIFNTDGQPVVMPEVFKKRLKAQMNSKKV